jgi:hypothetical protein
MNTNVPQDVIDLVVEHAENGNWPEFDAAIELLRAQRAGGEAVAYVLSDKLRILQHCGTLHVNLHRVLGQQIKPPSEYTALYTQPQPSLDFAAGMMKAAEICEAEAEGSFAIAKSKVVTANGRDTHNAAGFGATNCAALIRAAIPKESADALKEYVRPYVEILKAAKCPNCDGSGAIPVETVRVGMGCCGVPNPDNSCCGNAIPIPEPYMELQECQWCSERTAIVNSVLEGKL